MQKCIHKWIVQTILCESWPDSSLHVSIKHFMCTHLEEMELVKNVGHRR